MSSKEKVLKVAAKEQVIITAKGKNSIENK
jgi:hypothetical protein